MGSRCNVHAKLSSTHAHVYVHRHTNPNVAVLTYLVHALRQRCAVGVDVIQPLFNGEHASCGVEGGRVRGRRQAAYARAH